MITAYMNLMYFMQNLNLNEARRLIFIHPLMLSVLKLLISQCVIRCSGVARCSLSILTSQTDDAVHREQCLIE